MKRRYNLYSFLVVAALVSGCAVSPTYVNDGDLPENKLDEANLNPVHYKLEESFKTSPPQCVAVLPLTNATEEEGTTSKDIKSKESNQDKKKYKLIELTDESLEQLRWSLYSQLAPYAYHDIELAVVNNAIKQVGNNTDYAALGKALKCDTLLIGEVTDYRSGFFGIYSQTSIGVKMKLIRANNQEVLWEGNHVATNHGGSVPLSPVGVIMGLYSASENLSEEQLVRVKDDVFRRLLSTWSGTDEGLIEASENIQLAEAEKPEKEEYPFIIAVKNLFLRSGPGTKYEPASVLDQQDKIAIVDDKFSPWVRVKVENGPVGYVKDKYLSSVKQPNAVALLRDNSSRKNQ